MLTQEQVQNFVLEQGGTKQKIVQIDSSPTLKKHQIWEVWVSQKDVFHTRFVACKDGSNEPIYFSEIVNSFV